MSAELLSIGENIWFADGPVVSFFGFPYPTRMAAIRIYNGELFVWSPIALTPQLKAQAESLGRVKHLISPNKLHHLNLHAWKSAFPDALVYAPPGLAEKRRDLAFDAELTDSSAAAWAGEIDQVLMRGSFAMTEAVFFHRASRTALFADLIENFRPGWFKGWRRFVARLDGIVMPNPGAPREWRLSFWNGAKARGALEIILSWEPEQVIMAHGEIVRSDGADFIRNCFRWLG